MAQYKKTFTAADQDAEYKIQHQHNKNTVDLSGVTLYDNDMLLTVTADIFALGKIDGTDKPNYITLSLGNPIVGTLTLIFNYVSSGESGAGRRTFEQTTTATPDDDMRIIIGKAATPSLNMTLTQFFAHLLSKLGFLKLSENLNDLVNKEQARINLGVYSTVEMDNGLSAKASLYQSASGSVLGVSNTAAYNPTSSFHPATKRYADDYILFHGLISNTNSGTQTVTKYAGSLTVTCSHLPQEGKFQITHNKGDLNYIVVPITAGDFPGIYNVNGLSSTQFNVVRQGNYDFYLTIFRI